MNILPEVTDRCPVHGLAVRTAYSKRRCRCETCVSVWRALTRASRAANPEAARARQLKYREAHPDRVQDRYRRYRAENTEKCRGATRSWVANNREAIKEYRRRKWRTREGWAKAAVFRCRRRAQSKGLECTITFESVMAVWPADDVCPVLGVLFEIGGEGAERDNSPSIDRVDNERGYTPDNIQVISCRANALASNATPAELRAVAAWKEARI